MSYVPRAEALDYYPCRYGSSKLLFRGPRRKVGDSYVAVLGGTETFGRFVEQPFTTLVEAESDRKLVNLGYMNAGIDVFLHDQSIMDLCAKADATVIQLLGAQNLTNRFYSVHPRRNDRFLKASQLLETLYRDIDFAEFNFTRHLLVALQENSPERFVMVVEELKSAWLARMRQVLAAVGGKKILLWVGEQPPGDGGDLSAHAPDPLFVTRDMIEELRPSVTDVIEVVESPAAKAAGTRGMVFEPSEEQAAATAPNAALHREVAEHLRTALDHALS